MDNYSILQRNTLHGLSETAGCLYLRLLDVFQARNDRNAELRAFHEACRYERECGEVLDYILREGVQVDPATLSSLSTFFAERWRNNFMTRPST